MSFIRFFGGLVCKNVRKTYCEVCDGDVVVDLVRGGSVSKDGD